MPSRKVTKKSRPHLQGKPAAKSGASAKKKAGKLKRDLLVEKIIENQGNVSEAARQAGYPESTAKSEIYRIVRRQDVQERLQQRLKEAAIDPDEVRGVLNRILRADIDDCLTDDGSFSIHRARALGMTPLIREIKYHHLGGGIESVKMYGVLDAAKILSKIYGLEQEPQTNEFDAKRKKRDKAERKIEELMLRYHKTREEILERCPSLAKCLT